MDEIVECVPNFSEGRDGKVIDAIVAAAAAVEGVKVLDVDPGRATNRTVITFAGPPEGVEEAAFRAIRTAAELIDMSRHEGAHPRQGATDVCPLCPVSGVTMEECVALSRRLGERVGAELGIPVYLYERSATRPERRLLPDIRAGEYEALPRKLGTPEWAPDFGPNAFDETVRRAGVTAIGAREFLIAYNINLNTKDKKYASDIAMDLRETGRFKRGKSPTRFYCHGEVIRDEKGKALRKEGMFPFVKGVGWYIEEYGIAQVSLNLTNYKVTPMYAVFDACARLAAERGLRVTGSEVVGLVPLEALLEAGRHYLQQQHRSPGVPEEDLIRMAVKSLGLDELASFDPEKKIIEYRFRKPPPLAGLAVSAFADEVSRDSPAPGGGSAAALSGAIAASLAAMVANLTAAKKELFDRFDEMAALAARAQEVKDALLRAVDEDTEAFSAIAAASRLPKRTAEERKARRAAMEAASEKAASVPLRTAELCLEALRLARSAAGRGNPASLSDAGVAALAARAGFEGALLNVKINLSGIENESFREETKRRVDSLHAEFGPLYAETVSTVEKGL